MSLFLDLVLLAIMLLIVFISWHRGFISSLLNLASVVVSLIVTKIFHGTVAAFIDEKFIHGNAVKLVREKISDFSGNGDLNTLFTTVPEKFSEFLDKFGIDGREINEKFAHAGESAGSFADKLASDIGGKISSVLSSAIAIVGLFLVSLLVCLIISAIVKLMFQLPVLKKADKTLGLIAGIVTAVFAGWLLSCGFTLLASGLSAIKPELIPEGTVEGTFLIRLLSSLDPVGLYAQFVTN